MEVLSPSSAAYDHKTKFDIYEKYGVREYWITDPSAKFIIRYSLNSAGKYERAGVYEKSDFIELFFAEGEKLELSNVF